MDQSEEIKCQVLVQKFLEGNNYIIEIYDHYLSVDSISNDTKPAFKPNAFTQTTMLSLTTVISHSQPFIALNNTTHNSTRTTQAKQTSLISESNNMTQTPRF